jgi:hypothetical protein
MGVEIAIDDERMLRKEAILNPGDWHYCLVSAGEYKRVQRLLLQIHKTGWLKRNSTHKQDVGDKTLPRYLEWPLTLGCMCRTTRALETT